MNPTDRDQTAEDKPQSEKPESPQVAAGREESYATRLPEDRQGKSEGHRFTVLRPHAVGGLGRVMIAHDGQLNREIALKEILPGNADDAASRQRFLREAEITGALEHPGIVPVYSLGEFSDGRPFYAMRFVLGQDLRAAIDEYHSEQSSGMGREFQLRQLLGRFVDVCLAVDYAHNRGVVHRDLKPENIMLGDYGETLVVDWGLARSCDQEPDHESTLRPVTPSLRITPSHTRDGQVVGTPVYMSPEQAAGRLDLLGPAGDIYSLGATLYHLLTGQTPFDGDSSDVLMRVQRGLYPPAREVKESIPRPLEAICQKAMATRPADRYASARELALDVEHYLGDERVHAFAEPLWMRTWRWIRNHRAAVLSLMAAASVALTALTAGVILLGAANQRERAAKDEATRNYIESVEQRNRAEQNFRLAQDAVRQYYIRVSEETLLSQPGMQPLRNALLEQALGYFEQFLKQREGDPALQAELAQAAFYVGRIKETIDSPEQAIAYYEQAAQLYQDLIEAQASEGQPVEEESTSATSLQAEHARVLNAKGGAYQKLQKLDQAKANYEEARDIRARLASSNTDDHEAARELSNSLMNLGGLAMRSGDPDEAIKLMQHAQSLRYAHLQDSETQPKDQLAQLPLRRDLAMGYFNLALTQLRSGKSVQAENNFAEAATAFDQLVEREPAVLQHHQRLAMAGRLLGDLYATQGKIEQAIGQYVRSRDILQRQVDRNPEVHALAVDLAGTLMNFASLQIQTGKAQDGLENLTAAADILQKLADSEQATPRYRRDLGATQRATGQVLASLGRVDEAEAKLVTSQKIFTALVREFPNDQDYNNQSQETRQALQQLQAESK